MTTFESTHHHREDWYEEELEQYREWLAYAYIQARQSPDPSTQNAAVLVGPNGDLWPGIADVNRPTDKWVMREGDWDRPRKYALVEHAERNVIYLASFFGQQTRGCTMVACWASCADCARAIVQSGISRLIRHKRDPYGQWDESIALGDQIMKANGVEIIDVIGPLGIEDKALKPVLFSGNLIQP